MKKNDYLILSEPMSCSNQIWSGNMEWDHQVDQMKVIPLASLRQCKTMLLFFLSLLQLGFWGSNGSGWSVGTVIPYLMVHLIILQTHER